MSLYKVALTYLFFVAEKEKKKKKKACYISCLCTQTTEN